MLSESLRLQLAETSVKVVELIEAQPDATEIQVENVKFLRFSEARGDYAQTVATLNQLDPHGK
jgi:short-subunit dehydrogenase involved in D-alanine esterification of teichoic acids